MSILAIGLALLWASLLWAILVGVPFALAGATLVAGLAVAGKAGPVPAAACLAAALAADIVARRFDRQLAAAGMKGALALSGGTAALGIAAGPDLGGLLAMLAMGRGGRQTLARAAASTRLLIIPRLIRGGVAVGVAIWLFSYL